jgi:hypothetical protein
MFSTKKKASSGTKYEVTITHITLQITVTQNGECDTNSITLTKFIHIITNIPSQILANIVVAHGQL